MKKLSVFLFLFVCVACGASFTGPATQPSGPCGGHLECPGGGCCDEADFSGEGWQCGGQWPDCPAGTCCFMGDNVGPGDPNAEVVGVKKKPKKIVPLRKLKT